MKIRRIREEDTARVLAIYQPYIEETVITFEYEVPSLEVFRERIRGICKNFPWLVCEEDNKVVGYAYASYFSGRTAFAWDCELSVYLDKEYYARGIGSVLYQKLLKLVKIQGYYNAYALIALPNQKSEVLHNKLGFNYEGCLNKAGYKFQKWVDLGYYVKRLQSDFEPKDFPVSIHKIDDSVIKKILEEE
jgi:L-amino acid N-acyltransferase YncA